MDISKIPSEDEYFLITEKMKVSLGIDVDNNSINSDDYYRKLDEDGRLVYICPSCRNLYLEKLPNSDEYDCYIMEKK